jgi:hypothetical protein
MSDIINDFVLRLKAAVIKDMAKLIDNDNLTYFQPLISQYHLAVHSQ